MKASQAGSGFVGPALRPPERYMSTLCGGKAAYDTAKEAHEVAKHRQKYEKDKLWVYKCQDPRCPYYHLTKLKPPDEWRR